MDRIPLVAPFRAKKVVKLQAWRLVVAVVAFAVIGQSTMLLQALPGGFALADAPTPSSSVTASYDPADGKLTVSGTYDWTACDSGNNDRIVGIALFVDGPDADSAAGTPLNANSEALDGTGMQLPLGLNPCKTSPGPWTSTTHNATTNTVLQSAPSLVCAVAYDVRTGVTKGSHSQIGAGVDRNTDNSYEKNGATYLTGRCVVPTIVQSQVCPPGNVKFEVGRGYEYTDGTGTIDVVPGTPHNKTLWAPANGYNVTKVCVKIGGPNGGSLLYPPPAEGTSGPYSYDISHVVLTTAPLPAKPAIKVIKKVAGGTAVSSNWTMHVGNMASFPGDPNGTTREVPAGGYYISESGGPANYVASFAGDCDAQGFVQAESGKTKTCTVTNTYQPTSPKVTVIKKVVGGTATSGNWTMHIGNLASFAGSATGTTRDVPAGNYIISETGGPANYVASFAGDCDAQGNLKAEYDKTKVCTVTNTYVAPSVCKLEMTKSVDKTTATSGTVLTYTINYKNVGTGKCTGGGVRIEDTVPAGTTYNGVHTQTVSNDTGNDGIRFGYQYASYGLPINDGIQAGAATLSWNANVVSPGESGVVTFQTKVNTLAACTSKTLTNTARIYSDQTYPPAISSNTVTTTASTACNGSLKLTKVVDSGSASVDSFNFTISPDPNGVGTIHPTNGVYTFANLPAGTYTVTEQSKAGYHQVSSTCTSVQVAAGQAPTCVVHNAIDTGTLKVVKQVMGSKAPPSDWQLYVKQNGTNVAGSPQPGTSTGTTYQLPVGTYQVNETGPAGYKAEFSASCPAGYVTVAANQTATCVITNTKQLYTITLDKQGPATIDAGQNMTYNLVWAVTGNTSVTNAIITDPIPANTTFVSAGNGGTFANGKVTWNLGSQKPAASGTVTVTVKVANPIANDTTLTNTACFDTTETIEVCDTTTTKVKSSPTIHLDKQGPATIDAGQNMTYSLVWTVGGTAPVTNGVITDPLPANTSFVSADNGGTFSNGNVTWNLGSKVPGNTGTVTVTVKVNSPLANGTILTNGACFDTTETNPACDEITTKVNSGPTVNMDKQGPATIDAGQNLTYSLAWSIGGNAPSTNTIVTDPIPANTTFVTANNSATFANGIVSWNLGTKNPGDHGTLSVIVKVNSPIANDTIISNTACVDSNETEPGCDTTTTKVSSSPSLSISKSNSISAFANPGHSVTYTVIVTNAASATDTAHAVVMTDVLPAGFTFVDGGASTKSFTLGEMGPGASITTVYTVKISDAQAAGVYTNTATAKGSNTPAVSATSNVEVRIPQTLGVEAKPDLSITKTASPNITNPGKTVTYTLTIKNVSDVKATNLVITDTLPAGFIFVDTGKATKTWKIPSLASGAVVKIPYDVKVNSTVKAGKYTNTVTLQADNVDKKQAKATVEVKIPQVAGLATTGVGPMDYLFFILGLGLIGSGTYLFRRQRRLMA